MARRNLVIGDIHGRAQALREVLAKCQFDPSEDFLIILGDIVDGGLESKECVDILLEIPNKVYILGNHDLWFIDWFENGLEPYTWTIQGGQATIDSYGGNYRDVPKSHKQFFQAGVPFFIFDDCCFVHGGFNPHLPIEEQNIHDLVWNRELINFSKRYIIPKYKHVYVGHTATPNYRLRTYNNLTMVDTGAGWDGKLTILDIATKEYWQSKNQERLR